MVALVGSLGFLWVTLTKATFLLSFEHGQKTDGLVLGHYGRQDISNFRNRGNTSFTETRVSFLDSQSNKEVTFYYDFLTPQLVDKLQIGSLEKGRTVTVIYDPTDPNKAIVDFGLWNWIQPIATGLLASGFLLIAIKFKL